MSDVLSVWSVSMVDVLKCGGTWGYPHIHTLFSSNITEISLGILIFGNIE
jgi:hypothetical protein